MGRRQLAGKDMKIAQGQRRDAFFARMKRKGGVARLPSHGAALAAAATAVDEPVEAEGEDEAAESETATEA
jgi:hypothetical protein